MANSLLNKADYQLKLWWRQSPWMEQRYQKLREQYITQEFLGSSEYEQLFLTSVDDPKSFLDYHEDAEANTANFKFRHIKMGRALGCWRWKGLFTWRKKILPYIFNPELQGIDFGGAAGPVATPRH